MFKKTISLCITLIVIVSLFVGCGSNSSTNNEVKVNNEISENTDTKSTDEKVKITYVSWMSKGEDKPLLEEFMKQNPNIVVEDEVLEGSKYDQLLKTRIISGDAPDVFLLMPSQYDSFVKEGWLMDVTNESGTAIMNDSQDLMELYLRDGKVYGTMINGGLSEAFPIYYNKKYFEKLGIIPPTTIEEFYQVCDTIIADGKEPMVFGAADSWTTKYIPLAYSSAIAADKYGINFDNKIVDETIKLSDIFKPALEMLKEVVDKGYVSKASLSLKYDQSVQYFADGNAAMIVQGPWLTSLESIKNAEASGDFELGAFVFPLHKSTDGLIHIYGDSDRSIGIYGNTEQVEAAKKLYNFFLEKENLSKYLEEQSLMTLVPNIDVTLAPALQEYSDVVMDPSKYVIHYSKGDYVLPPSLSGMLGGESWQNIIAGATVEEVMQQIDQEYEDNKDQVKEK